MQKYLPSENCQNLIISDNVQMEIDPSEHCLSEIYVSFHDYAYVINPKKKRIYVNYNMRLKCTWVTRKNIVIYDANNILHQ